ncbi:hypothetical protein FPS10_19265 [Pseudoruegeria sp. M32A2M]|nr:hypothetical protein [Pseudoruegeria sp. M32A2M]
MAARQLAGTFSQTKSWDAAIRRFRAISEIPAPESAAPERSEPLEPTPAAATPVSVKAQSGAGSLVSLGASGTVHSFWQENE